MRKSKFMKALLVFGMSAVTATSIVGFTACDPDSGNGGGHTHTYDGWLRSDTEHWQECVDDQEEANRGPHKDNNGDNRCDACNVEMGHTFASEWTKKPEGHYYAATCDHTTLKDQEGPHVDDGTTEGSTANDNTCDVCGYVGETSQGYKDFVAANAGPKLIDDTFFGSKELAVFNKWGTAGLYASANNETNKVAISGGKANLITPNTNPATHLFADFGDVAGNIVEGYFVISDVVGSNDYTPVQFNAEIDGSTKEIFGLNSNKGGVWKYRLNGDKDTTTSGANTCTATWAAGGAVHFIYDTNTNQISVDINGGALVTDLQLASGAKLLGIKFASGDSKGDTFSVDDIVVVSKAVDLAGYKKATKTNAATAKTKIAIGITVDYTAADTELEAVDTATSNEECDTAYNKFLAKLISAYSDGVSNKIKADYPKENYSVTQNESKYEAAIAALTADLKVADTLEAVTAAYTKADGVLKAVGDNDYWNGAAFTITIGGEQSGTVSGVRAADDVTQALLDAKLTLTATQYAKYYTDEDCTQPLTLPTKISSDTNVYVKIGVKASVTIDSLVAAGAFNNIEKADDGKWSADGTVNFADNIVFKYIATKIKLDTVSDNDKATVGYSNGINFVGKSTANGNYISVTVTKGCTIKAIAYATGADKVIAITPAPKDISDATKLEGAKPLGTIGKPANNKVPVTAYAHVDGPKASEEGAEAPESVTYYICCTDKISILEIVIEYDI